MYLLLVRRSYIYLNFVVNYTHRVFRTASRGSFIFEGSQLIRRWNRRRTTNMGYRAMSVVHHQHNFEVDVSPTHREDFPKEMKTKLDEARDEALGRRDERTSERSIYRDGTYTGGTAFEHNNRAHGVHGTRCYTLVNSFERQPLLAAPSVTSKRTDTRWDDSLLMRRNIVRVCYAFLG